MIILIILILVLILTLFLINKTFKKKDNILDEVKLQENAIKNDGFALMLQQSDGTYKESKSSSWPTDMVFNAELSGCMDANGKKIDNALNYNKNTNSIKLKVNGTTHCYVYFDQADNNFAKYLINNVSSNELWDSPLEGDGYRYVGYETPDQDPSISTGPSNYICFGTTNKSKCLNDQDTYMYRIIGIFEDEDGDNHLKLIKKTALDTTYQWASDAYSNVDFTGSEILNGLSSSYFMTNTSYPYMQNTNWKNMIELWDYKYANTKTFEYYQQNYKENDSNYTGPSYSESNVLGIYLHELNRSNKNVSGALYAYTYQDSAVYPELPSHTSYSDPNIGEWGWEHTEVSLMYVSDYALSLGSDALKYISQNDYSKLKKGWIHLSNNDSSAPSSSEWTMTKFGLDPLTTGSLSRYDAWSISSTGTIDYTETSDYLSYRPVFYLKSNAKYGSGTGTSSDPYIIDMGVEEETTVTLISNLSSNDLWESTLEGDGSRFIGTNPNNYICFGTTDKDECKNNSYYYMYRVVGIFEDEDGNKHAKLIKARELSETYAWHSDNQTDINWEKSDLYRGLNGSYFLTNTEYSYMQDSTWTNKISNWNYTTTNTESDYGVWYSEGYNSVKTIYLHELNRNGKSNEICYNYQDTSVDCNSGNWNNVKAKIGIMYVSDYALSLGSAALNYIPVNDTNILKTGWLKPNNGYSEWTMTTTGLAGDESYAYYINSSGRVYEDINTENYYVCPVFYLESNVEFADNSGNGSENDPYIIKK